MSRRDAPGPLPRVGVGLLGFSTSLVSDHSWSSSYRAGLETAREVEALGLDSVWLTEHHFVPDGYCPSVMVTAAAILAATDTLVVGTAVLLLPLADPERLAHQIKSLGELSDRLRLAVALGYREEEFKGLERDRRKRGRLMDAHIEYLLDEVGDRGNLTIAAAAHVGVERAMRYDLPLLIDAAVPLPSVVEWVREYRAVSDKEVTLSRECWITDDGSAPASAIADREFGYQQYISWDWSASHDEDDTDSAQIDLEQIVAGSREHWLRATPEDFERILVKLSAAGVDRIQARLSWSGVPLDKGVIRSIAGVAGRKAVG